MMITDKPNINILTIQEVSKLLRVHRTTVSRYAMSGELKSYVIGNRRLFKENDVWVFFENRIALEYVSERRKHGNSSHTEA
jgi:excisionase family DNA binding protein